MQVLSRADSKSARLLRELAVQSDVLSKSNITVAWGLQAAGAVNGSPKVSNFDQLIKFREAKLHVPEAIRGVPAIDRATWIGRMDYHTRGKDIKFSTKRGFDTSEYFVKLIEPPSDEWRLTVAFGAVLARGKKVPGPATRSDIIRNRTKGWVLDHTIDPPKGMREAAKRAVGALGYDFGSVDIIHKDDKFYILEVNKASGLDLSTAQAYIRAFERHVVNN